MAVHGTSSRYARGALKTFDNVEATDVGRETWSSGSGWALHLHPCPLPLHPLVTSRLLSSGHRFRSPRIPPLADLFIPCVVEATTVLRTLVSLLIVIPYTGDPISMPRMSKAFGLPAMPILEAFHPPSIPLWPHWLHSIHGLSMSAF